MPISPSYQSVDVSALLTRPTFRGVTSIYNFAAQGHVQVSFETSEHTANADALGALRLLEDIRQDPGMAEVLIKGTEYIRCEIRLAASREMVTKLEDFLRRRSKIALIARKQTIRAAPGLMEACRILFGDEAQQKFDEYFETH